MEYTISKQDKNHEIRMHASQADQENPGEVGWCSYYINHSDRWVPASPSGKLSKQMLTDLINLLEHVKPEDLPEFVKQLKLAKETAYTFKIQF